MLKTSLSFNDLAENDVQLLEALLHNSENLKLKQTVALAGAATPPLSFKGEITDLSLRFTSNPLVSLNVFTNYVSFIVDQGRCVVDVDRLLLDVWLVSFWRTK